jgi:hypothetical protein
VIGTNFDLKAIQHILDCRIMELKQLVGAAPDQAWISDRLAAIGRQRIAVSAILVNRRIEAAKKVVDLSRWFSGNGPLSDTSVKSRHRTRAESASWGIINTALTAAPPKMLSAASARSRRISMARGRTST